ncbi:MAG: cytochrome c biogenesis protein ResB [Oscillospiraceae bacterium]|nr:cytochrome c biogenesis protein ResB [Oscillospiraceae bacterium]
MKKIWQFLRSMRFGLILLGLIAAFSVVGTLIPQGREVAYYAQTYRAAHGIVLMLGLHHVFSSWYFALLLALLCLNLTLCSVVRVRVVARGGRNAVAAAAQLPNEAETSPEESERLRAYLVSKRCKAEHLDGGVTVWHKNGFGRWGTFITHLSILLTVLLGAAALYLPTVTDRTCLPGESLTMPDGTVISVDAFSIEDENGRLDYASELRILLSDGRMSGSRRVSVNEPASFGAYKVYQQTYGTAGSLTVTNAEGGADDFTLTEPVFLSADGRNGVWYEALFPGYIKDPSGNVTLITNTTGSYDDPVYRVQVASDGVYTPTLAFPGDTVQVGGLTFRFNDPIEYPGLRIKRTPTLINALLIAAFVLMTVGLYVTFFMQPVLVRTDAAGYAVGGPKPEGMRMELALLLNNKDKEKQE